MFDYNRFKSLEELDNFIMRKPDYLSSDDISLIKNMLFVKEIQETTTCKHLMKKIHDERKEKYNKYKALKNQTI